MNIYLIDFVPSVFDHDGIIYAVNKFTWLISLIQACFSCIVGATKCMTIGVPYFCSHTNLKSRLACSTHKVAVVLPVEPELVAPLLSLTPLLADDMEHTDDSAGNQTCNK